MVQNAIGQLKAIVFYVLVFFALQSLLFKVQVSVHVIYYVQPEGFFQCAVLHWICLHGDLVIQFICPILHLMLLWESKCRATPCVFHCLQMQLQYITKRDISRSRWLHLQSWASQIRWTDFDRQRQLCVHKRERRWQSVHLCMCVRKWNHFIFLC